MNGAEATVRMLQAAGVEVIFGLCGDTSLPLYEALHDVGGGLRHVLTRDERSAAFMADAYARLSGRVGVCEGPSGGGALYILPGVAEADGSSVPVVCLTSDIDARESGRGTLTELDQHALFAPITRWSHVPTHGRQVPGSLRQAFVRATTGALGATHVGLPFNVQLDEVPLEDVRLEARYGTYPADRVAPEAASVERAAHVLAEARRPMIVAGAGVLRSGAWDELRALAHLLGAPVATSISGKGSIAETDPYALGVIGSNGGLAYRHEMVREADVLCYVGCSQGSVTTQKWTLPADGEKTIVHLDAAPERIGRSYRTAVGLVGDARLGLSAIATALDASFAGRAAGKVDPDEIGRRRAAYLASVEELSSDETPIRPERFVRELSMVLPETAVICADPGTPCPYLSAYYPLPRAGRWFATPRAHGALGYALPAVCGAWFARPDAARCVGVMGDGSFGISVGELETLVRLDLPVTLIVLNNRSYGWIKAGQRAGGGKYYSVDFSDTDHARVAAAYGLTSQRVEDPRELEPALRAALTASGPALVDIVVQPLEDARAPVSKWIA